MRWCTVTVTDPDGRRHSVDVQATSTFDAAHLFVVEAKKERAVGLPKPTLATMFEVVAAGLGITGTDLMKVALDTEPRVKLSRGTGGRSGNTASTVGVVPYQMQAGERSTT